MKLTAALIVRDEMSRYLTESVPALLEFCDEVKVLDDGSTDGGPEWLARFSRVSLLRRPHAFFEHEGRARQDLLDWTLEGHPTHVLAIDADEFVSDGAAVRAACREPWAGIRSLAMREVWELDGDCVCLREDGGWRSHPVGILWAADPDPDAGRLSIMDRALACGRVPTQLRAAPGPPVCDVLHFGWANREERRARYERYAVHDGGAFHAGTHLESIMWPDDRVELDGICWPPALEARFHAIRVAAGYPPPVRPLV